MMPTLSMGSAEPPLSEILARVDVVDAAGIPPPLRVVLTSPRLAADVEAGGNGEASLMVEFDTLGEAPAGWTWLDLDPVAIARLEPQPVRAAVAAWARERADGWSPLRPQWSHPGWFAAASGWMVDSMAAQGSPALSAPRIHQLWGLSVVLGAPSQDGDFFFKCSADIFRHEALATHSLSARTPESVPEVVAVDAAQGWMLMRDFDAADLGDQDQSMWHEGLAAHARIQQRWLGSTDELVALGLPIRSLTDLSAWVEAMTDDATLLGRIPVDFHEHWLAAAPALIRACQRLDELGPGPTLVHGDLHPWNVAYSPTTTRVFDWTDAAVSHPFVDLATYIFSTDDRGTRRRLVDAYASAWSTVSSEHVLREAMTLGLVVGALYQVQTYRALLPTLMRNGADDGLAGSDLTWLKRSLMVHEEGLESPA
jgi:fructosamine-3-kinase